MIDFHCHLDLYEHPISLLNDVQVRCKFVLAVTTSPRAWLKTSEVFSEIDNIAVALGLHPEIIERKINERELFLSLITKANYLGEVGLDGTGLNRATLDMQIDFFNQAVRVAERYGGRIMSIHSRGAVRSTLNIVEKEMEKSVPVLHWFTGTKKELEWANAMGCWFSINPLMLKNAKGIAMIKNIPISKMLPETDGPFALNNRSPFMPWDTNLVIEGVAKNIGASKEFVTERMHKNLCTLISS